MKTKIAFKCVEMKGINSKEVAILPKLDETDVYPKILMLTKDGNLEFIGNIDAIGGGQSETPQDNSEELKGKIASLEKTIQGLAKNINAMTDKIKTLEKAATVASK